MIKRTWDDGAMITQQILWRKGTVMIFMRVNGDDCYRGRNLWGHLLLPTYIFLYWQIISYCGERFPFNFFFLSESMIFIAICCRSSFCLKLERSLPVASICLPAFLLSFPERQRHPGPSGGELWGRDFDGRTTASNTWREFFKGFEVFKR